MERNLYYTPKQGAKIEVYFMEDPNVYRDILNIGTSIPVFILDLTFFNAAPIFKTNSNKDMIFSFCNNQLAPNIISKNVEAVQMSRNYYNKIDEAYVPTESDLGVRTKRKVVLHEAQDYPDLSLRRCDAMYHIPKDDGIKLRGRRAPKIVVADNQINTSQVIINHNNNCRPRGHSSDHSSSSRSHSHKHSRKSSSSRKKNDCRMDEEEMFNSDFEDFGVTYETINTGANKKVQEDKLIEDAKKNSNSKMRVKNIDKENEVQRDRDKSRKPTSN